MSNERKAGAGLAEANCSPVNVAISIRRCATCGCELAMRADVSAALDLAKQYERELNAANEDVLLHSMLRVELTNALKLDSLKPRTRQGNSELVALVDELKSSSVAALSNE